MRKTLIYGMGRGKETGFVIWKAVIVNFRVASGEDGVVTAPAVMHGTCVTVDNPQTHLLNMSTHTRVHMLK